MRNGFAVLLMLVLLFAGGYFYYVAQAVCAIPVGYYIRELDDRFNLSHDEARLILTEAESRWEDATGKNLFTYEEEGSLAVDFVFDERQAFTEAESEFKERLDAAENINDAIGDTYAALVDKYKELQLSYADKVETYERRLSEYNEVVSAYNQQGGAPPEEYERLAQEKEALDQEQESLNDLAEQLNALVDEINKIGEKGNTLVKAYNREVGEYNETFGESREFTQGDYTKNVITIYTYKDMDELRLVLAHELGHALRLDHVEGEESIMHYLIGGQKLDFSPSGEDIAEFNRICGELSLWDRIAVLLKD